MRGTLPVWRGRVVSSGSGIFRNGFYLVVRTFVRDWNEGLGVHLIQIAALKGKGVLINALSQLPQDRAFPGRAQAKDGV